MIRRNCPRLPPCRRRLRWRRSKRRSTRQNSGVKMQGVRWRQRCRHARRIVITKVEVSGPGQLNGFPGECNGGTCAATPDKWPIVIISTRREPGCERSIQEFAACMDPLSVQCGLGEEAPEPPTYIWWERDSAGHRKPHSCAYFGIEHPSDLTLLGFVPHVSGSPTSFSLVVQGRDVPIRLAP